MLVKKFNKKSISPSRVLYVGVDIGKFKHCARAKVSRNEWTKGCFFGQNRRGFDKLMREIGRWCKRFNCNVIEVGMEPTGNYWKPLFSYLVSRGFTVRLIPPVFVKCEKNKWDNSPLKSDEKDALLIANLLYEGNYIKPTIFPEGMKEARSLVKLYSCMDKEVVRWTNRLESWLSEHFPEFGVVFKNLNCVTVRVLLEKYPFPSLIAQADPDDLKKLLWKASRGNVDGDKAELLLKKAKESVGVGVDSEADEMYLKFVLENLNFLEEKISELKAKISESVKSVSIYPILISLPGVGDMTVAAIIAALGDLKNYKSYRQVLKKVGLNLYHLSSGTHKGKKRISKRGMGVVRKMLYMAAIYHTREGSYYYDKYRSLLGRGVQPKEALVVIMRKLLKVEFALVRDGRVFEEDYRCDMNGATDKDEKPLLCARAA